MKRKRLFFVGIPQAHVKPSIERAQRLGYEVILGDSQKNLAEKAHLISGADSFIVTDYTNYEDLSAATYRLQEEAPLDGIITFKETGSVVTAKVTQDYRLKGNNPEVIEACNNKFMTRNLLKQAGMPGPAFALCNTFQEVQTFWEHVKTPVVIKPHNLQGSMGVVKVETSAELEAAFNTCIEHCEQPLVLVEQLIVGREISLEAMVYRGKVVLFGVTEKALYPGTFVEAGHTSPDSGPEMSYVQYEQLVQRIIEAMGITFGPLHIEGFHTRQGFVPGEIHTRYGGDNIVALTEIAMKCDMTSPIFAELGDIPYEITFGEPREVAGIRFLDIKPGIVTSVEGVDEVKMLPGVVNIEIECKPGDVIKPPHSSFDRAGWILAKAANNEELHQILKKSFQRLHIITYNI